MARRPDGVAVWRRSGSGREWIEPHAQCFGRRHDLVHHPLARAAFHWVVTYRDRISPRVFDEVVADRAARGYYHMEHPGWKELMHHLRALNSPQRDEIRILGLHPLQLFQDRTGDLNPSVLDA